MSEKKGFLSNLFGRKSGGGCCAMEITEKPRKVNDGGCCNLQIVPEENAADSTKTDEKERD